MTHGIINPGNIAGTFLCLWLLCVLIPPVHGAIKAFCFKHLFTKIVFRVVNIGFIAFAIYCAIVTSAMVLSLIHISCMFSLPMKATA